MAKLTLADERKQQDAMFDAAQKISRNSSAAAVITIDTQPNRQLSDAAYKHWKFIISNAPEGQLQMTDVPMLEQYCEVLVKLEELTLRLTEEDVSVENARGTPVANPYYSVFNTISVLCGNLAARLRLIPSMRQMSQAEKKSQDLGKNQSEQRKQPSKRAHLLFGGGQANVVPLHQQVGDDEGGME